MKTPSDIVNTFANYVTRYVSDLSQPAFVAWIREDRVILSVNPGNVKNITALTRDNVRHDISTLLGGVPVKLSNTTGLYFQVGYQPEVKRFRLDSVALNLSAQPTVTSVPIGMTTNGPLWVSLEELRTKTLVVLAASDPTPYLAKIDLTRYSQAAFSSQLKEIIL